MDVDNPFNLNKRDREEIEKRNFERTQWYSEDPKRKEFLKKRDQDFLQWKHDFPKSLPNPFVGPPSVQKEGQRPGCFPTPSKDKPPHRSGRNPIFKVRLDNAYGDKTLIEIEKEIKEKQDDLRKEFMDINKDPKASFTKVHSLLQSLKSLKIDHHSAEESYFNKIIKEAGNEFLHYLLQNALAREDARTWNYNDILKIHLSSPEDYKLWRAAMEDEFKSLENRKIWVNCQKVVTQLNATGFMI